ncbi:beta-N-acetylhexosaminidase [Olivibacter domesticus]|uniref:beta-N-acetylhexosaminidase n=1 Tax=Olivibacter domesticus TaxID=407022 RepID=A0A1H7TBM9_OLID1|nr:beta-N-acetylhexosaminidase [Olivibacter domesticus]SEL81919.1 hexosaminidase [Olivibacter domesticus]
MVNRFLIWIVFVVLTVPSYGQQLCPIIPAPLKASRGDGVFILDKHTFLLAEDSALQDVASYLQYELLRLKSLPLAQSNNKRSTASAIHLRLGGKKNMDNEAYHLMIKEQEIVIEAGSTAGIFNGASSLVQLISGIDASNDKILIPAWQIEDEPAYPWRGLMLDESRFFIGKEKVMDLIDWMAFYKLNKLHWHLTDEPAWRLEIKKYPKLALIGGVGDHNNPTKPAAFYTQREIAEIVSYAAKRNISVIPEIDMPGHATAANRAYPQYNGGGSKQHPDFTFDPGKEETYTFLSNIVSEANALFPGGMMHLGGDEVSFGSDKWMQNEGIKKLMQKHELKGLKDIERYFMERMADSVYQLNSKLLVWDEMADINLPKDSTIIFWWRHDKPEQLQKSLDKGYQTVICPRLPYYFDFVQDSTHRAGRKWGKRYNPLREVYSFSVDSLLGNVDQKNLVLGLQANLWTETVTNLSRVDYLLFPRLAGLAEAAWSDKKVKSYASFEERLKGHLQLYRTQNIYFYNPFQPNEIPEPVYFKKDRKDLNAEEN